jgi:hypothetical protein
VSEEKVRDLAFLPTNRFFTKQTKMISKFYVVGKLLVALGSSLTTQEISIHSDPIGLGYE